MRIERPIRATSDHGGCLTALLLQLLRLRRVEKHHLIWRTWRRDQNRRVLERVDHEMASRCVDILAGRVDAIH